MNEYSDETNGKQGLHGSTGSAGSNGSGASQGASTFDHKTIEAKWQDAWRKKHIFEVDALSNQPKYFILEMFPYPSGTIHMGHVRNYSIGDVIARYKSACGFNVMHPMGWDAFGLPAENAAIKNKTHPAKWTYSNIAYMKRQLERLGCLFDWRRELATCTPDYYKWEQLFFIKLYEKGLAYRKLSTVNWCLSCNTVLANEQVEEGRCWRCENEVTTKELTQWFFKVTQYAEDLLQGLDDLTGWPERVRTMQKHWIGRSEGTEVVFEVAEGPHRGKKIPIFTTRVDTICGVSFVALAPEHPMTLDLVQNTPQHETVNAFVEKVRKLDKIKRTDENFEKEGVALGVSVINPVTQEKIPLYTANFVLMDYSSGAVMAVPGHDTRDFQFAKKYGLPIKQVIAPQSSEEVDLSQAAYTSFGQLIDSKQFTGLTSEKALSEISSWLSGKGLGRVTVNYKLRDWGVSRQRYWGAPIPIIHCAKCGEQPVLEKDLPVVLPEDVEFTGVGASPLAKNENFLNVSCPKCSGPATRETDTMDTFVESSWYYLRYCSLPTADKPFSKEDAQYWLPIDQYIGGIEHATMHLLYFRFFHRALQDIGYLPKNISREPAKHLLNQGIVYKDGAKMSKSKGNIVDPDGLFEKYGADTTRIFTLFAAPPEKVLEWNDQAVEGAYRFLGRVWRLVHNNLSLLKEVQAYAGAHASLTNVDAKKLRAKIHQTIQKVSLDLEEGFRFNTAIAAIMELVNETYGFKVELHDAVGRSVLREAVEAVICLLCPFAPHLCEELWQNLGFQTLLSAEPWKKHSPDAVETDTATYVIQVNGKLRANLVLPKDIAEEDLKRTASQDSKVMTYLEGKTIVKTIVVPQKLVNFVVK